MFRVISIFFVNSYVIQKKLYLKLNFTPQKKNENANLVERDSSLSPSHT